VGAALACNLQPDDGNSGGDRPQPTASLPPSPIFIIPTATLLPSPIPTITQIPPTQVNCAPYTLWPVYVVALGDTLGEIATRTGTTVNQLMQANCLIDPELIYEGQALYVPRIPATQIPAASATPTLPPNAPVFGQALSADQHWIDGSGQAVTYLPTTRVTVGVVSNAYLVDFYVNDPYGGAAISIGQDNDPWDGAFIDYDFPAAGTYTFLAIAQNDAMRLNSTVFTVRYDPTYSPVTGRVNTLTITPYTKFENGWYTLAGATTVTVTWRDAPVGALQVEFTLSSTGTGGTPQVIGVDLFPPDGAVLSWGVPRGMTAQLQAVATMPGGGIQRSEIMNVTAP
ncbi:MAG: LysM peptidoglycan-binding domain-containing protein, partial [Chloroflexi bacterium]|nr:LysM peptidoglycan-binding domain-containing protein [Chloroflexota bacterium]